MTILIAHSANLIAGSLITEVVSPDGRYVARRGLTIPGWVITLAGNPGPIIRVYDNAPGMNALVAMRRWLAEGEHTKREKGGEQRPTTETTPIEASNEPATTSHEKGPTTP